MIELIRASVIRVFSDMNTWIDCIFIVDEANRELAITVLDKALDYFHSDEGADWCYGDLFEKALTDAGIDYEAFYTKDNDEWGDDYESD